MDWSAADEVIDRHITMEQDKETDGLGRSSERDSWSEEIDPLRSDNGRDSWSGVGDSPLWRESFHTLEDDVMNLTPNKRDSLSLKSNGDPQACETGAYRDTGFVVEKGHTQDYKRDIPLWKSNVDPQRDDYRSKGLVAEKGHNQDYKRDHGQATGKVYPVRLGYERDSYPTKGYERLSVDRAHTMKDFEKQITELKKENFNLKLRIYFLEEQIQRRCDNSSEDLHRMNIELKVEVESLKHDFQEKQNLLIRASKAMESLATEHGLAMQQLKDLHLRQLQDLQEDHQQKVQLLEEDREQEKAELEKACMILEQERRLRYVAEERLLACNEQVNKTMTVLEERDWVIQCLNETLRNKDSLIDQLEKQIKAMMPHDSSRGSLFAERDLTEGHSVSPDLPCRTCLKTKSSAEEREEENVNEWQKKVKEMENLIHDLRQKLEDNKAGLAAEEKNALKRDKAIQGLTLALKTKTRENQKLQKEVDNLNAALDKAREVTHHHHQQGGEGSDPRESGDPDYKKLVITIQAQQDLCSRLRQYERDSGSLQKELDAILMLRQWLEKDIQANEDLRRILESQIVAKYRESDSLSYLGDQTSYLSICLRNPVDGPSEANRPLMSSAETQTESLDPVPALKWQQKGPLDWSVTETLCQNVSQTELMDFSNKALLIDLNSFEGQASGDGGRADVTQPLKVMATLHTDKQAKCRSNRLTRSKIPILLKSSLSSRLTSRLENHHLEVQTNTSNPESPSDSSHDEDYANKAEVEPSRKDLQRGSSPRNNKTDVIGQERIHSPPQREKSHELEIQAAASNPESPAGNEDYPDGAEVEPSGRDLQSGSLPNNNRIKVLQLEDSGLKHMCSPPQSEKPELESEMLLQTLYKELQEENLQLTERLQSAQREIERLRLQMELVERSNPELIASDAASRDLPGPSVRMENIRLSDHLISSQTSKRTMDTEDRNLPEPSVLKQLQTENLKHEQIHTKSSTDTEDGNQPGPPFHNQLQIENLTLAGELRSAQMEIERLHLQVNLVEGLNAKFTKGEKNDLHGPSVQQQQLQVENLRLTEQLKRALMDLERLRTQMDLEDSMFTLSMPLNGLPEPSFKMENLKHGHIDPEVLRSDTDPTKGNMPVHLSPKHLQMENLRLTEQLKPENLNANEGENAEDPNHQEVLIENLRQGQSNRTQMELPAEQGTVEDLSISFSPDGLEKSLQITKELKPAQMDFERSQDGRWMLGNKDDVDGVKSGVMGKSLQEELKIENLRLHQQLKHAASDTERQWEKGCVLDGAPDHYGSKAGIDDTLKLLSRKMQREDLSLAKQLQQVEAEELQDRSLGLNVFNPDTEEKDLLVKELTLENHRLTELLKQAQMDIQTLQEKVHALANVSDFPVLDGANAACNRATATTYLKELQLVESLQVQWDIGTLETQHLQMDNEGLKTHRSTRGVASELGGTKVTQNVWAATAYRDTQIVENLRHDEQCEGPSDMEIHKKAKMDNEVLRKQESLMRSLNGDHTTESPKTGPTDQHDLPIEDLHLTEQLMDQKRLQINGCRDNSSDQSLVSKLRSENFRLSKALKSAQADLDRIQENTKKHMENSSDQTLIRELRSENQHLSEELKHAQIDLDNLRRQMDNASDQTLVKELRSKNHRLSEELKLVQIDLERLQKNMRGQFCNSSDQSRVNELELENLQPSEELKHAQIDTDSHENTLGCLNNSSDQSLVKELRSENLRLSEELKCAQEDVERLQKNIKLHVDNSSDHSLLRELRSDNSKHSKELKCAQTGVERLQKHVKGHLDNCSDQALVRSDNRSLSEELKHAQIDIENVRGHVNKASDQSLVNELMSENHRLSEQLRCAQAEIEKLRDEKTLLGQIRKLEDLDAEDPDSEHSFIDKTLTNSGTDAEFRFTSQNLARLRCHHDKYCMECADNQETLILQTTSFRRVATIQQEEEHKLLKGSPRSDRSIEDASLSKYDLLVQSQARELSHQRQKIKESHNLSIVCSKNFINILKAFEDLLPSSSLDSNIALGFREQLVQTVEWLKDLEYKLSDAYYGEVEEEDANSDRSTDSSSYTPSRLVPGHRMWADKHGGHVLGLVEDYNALRKQILEAAAVLQEAEALVDHGVQSAALNMSEHFGNFFLEKLGRTKQSLEEASCLLKLLWRVSLPLQSCHLPEETNLEIIRLRKRVLEQEKLLSGMVKRVYSESQMKEDVEKLIMERLAMTHEILKRAKGNLEVQVVEKL